MHIDYFYKNIKPFGSATQEYVSEKLGVLEELTNVESARVEADQEKHGSFHMSVDMRTDAGVFRAQESAAHAHACVDLIEEDLKRQIRRTKKKDRVLMKRGARSIKKKTVVDAAARF